MKPLTRQQSRAVDEWAIRELGISGLVLMENAGRGVADVLLSSDTTCRRVLVLCGKGNNGGDGFVIARHLMIRGVESRVVLLVDPGELQGDALTNFNILQSIGLVVEPASQLEAAVAGCDWICDWVIDAMLGTGAVGEPREPYRSAIEWLNSQSANVLAVDLPSGLDCDTGEPSEVTVKADVTCTFHAPKVGFTNPRAQEFLGELHVVSIGIPTRSGEAN
jgi:NAD(P)H-hydrate epimerase